MRVHVIGAVLRVVFQDEDGRRRPEGRTTEGLDNASKRQVVVGHVGAWRGRAGPGARGVIVGQPHDHQRRHGSFGYEALQLAKKDVGSFLIGDVEIVAGEFATGVGGKEWFVSLVAGGHLFTCFDIVGNHELAVVAEGDALALGQVPQVTAAWFCNIIVVALRHPPPVGAFVIVASPAAGVVGGNGLLEIVGGIGRHGPVVPVWAHLGVHEETVKQSKALRQRVMVGRDGSRKEGERCVAVALWHVAKHLVVRTVFLDDVDHMPNGRVDGVSPDLAPSVGPLHPRRETCQHRARGPRGERHGHRARRLAQGIRTGARSVGPGARLRIIDVRPGPTSLAVGDDE